ncbi:hypothetical protein GGP85_003133 [Salinibacter ruber]|jgi:hypothetical protein|uniref:hypothetical protein n=1 Tax=Salinibacter ruber TaxID=146919 RepID=UPI0021685D65|nr:hypothetical protein [Salinibacter ruber]MCS3827663.1 hypothetical protein [Salinibacter ruber]
MHNSFQTILPDLEDARRTAVQRAPEDHPLVDQEGYYKLVRGACEDIVLDLMIRCSWSTLGEEAFHEILKGYYTHEIEDKIREYGVVDGMWETKAPGTPAERQQALLDVTRWTTDEIGARSDAIIRRARRLFLHAADHVKIRVRRSEIQVVDLYQDAGNAGTNNQLAHKLSKTNAPL